MALGIPFGGGGGDILPFVKYDARAGRFFRNDREQVNGQYVSKPVDITASFSAVVDFENMSVGWMLFAAGVAPQATLVKHGEQYPARPSTDWKAGVKFLMKLASSIGGDIRECSSTAGAFLAGFDDLHNQYEAQKAANPGKLPIVKLVTTESITSGSGAQKSTNYKPVFEITGWAPRPADLAPKAAAPAPAHHTGAPSTGSRPAAAPIQTKPAGAPADQANDFG